MWLNTVLLTRQVLRPAALAAAIEATVASVTSTCCWQAVHQQSHVNNRIGGGSNGGYGGVWRAPGGRQVSRRLQVGMISCLAAAYELSFV
jgi:hypothetical protein